MSNFKKVLEIEKKYGHIINLAKTKSEEKLVSFENNLKLNEDVTKIDFRKELERDFNHQIKLLTSEGESMFKSAKIDAEFMFENAKSEAAVDFLLECIKNV